MKNYASSIVAGGVRRLAITALTFSVLTLAPREGCAITRYWLGTAGNNWSTPANWSPAGPPQNGDDLMFTNRVGTYLTNDLSGLSVRSLTFYLGFAVVGNPLTITDGISYQGSDLGMAMNNAGLTLGGNIYVEAHTSGTSLTMNCPINLNGFELAARSFNGGEVDFRNAISGSGIFDNATGTNFLAPFGVNNSLNGPVRVLAGTLNLDGYHGDAVPTQLEIDSGGTVVLFGDNQIATAASVVINAGSQLLLNGHTNYFSNLEMRGGLLDSGSGGLAVLEHQFSVHATNETATLAGFANLFFSQLPVMDINGPASPALDISANLTGVNAFAKTGSGRMRLSGNNDDLETTIYDGIVEADTDSAFGTNGYVDFAGGAVILRGAHIGNIPLYAGAAGGLQIDGRYGCLLTCQNTSSWAGPVSLSTNLFVYVGGDMTFSGPITGPGGLSFWYGDAHLTGSQNNTFTGTMISRCELLELNKSSGATAYAGDLVVGGGSDPQDEVRWLQDYQHVYANVTLYPNALINLTNHFEDFYALTFNGGTVDTGAGQVTLYGPLTVNATNAPATINGTLGLPSGAYPNNPFIVYDSPGVACDLTINAAIVGPGVLVKQGPGTLCLYGNSTYTGVTFVQDGILEVDYDLALGANNIGEGTTVYSGATLRLAPGVTLSEPLALEGTGFGGLGALNTSGQTTFNSPIPALNDFDLSAPTTLRVEGAGSTFILNGIVSGTGPLTKAGPGRIVMYGSYSNSYSGDTIVAEGTLEFNKPQFVVAAPGNLVVGPAPGGSSAVARFDNTGELGGTVATVNFGSLLDLFNNNLTLSELDLNDGGSVQTGSGSLLMTSGAAVNVGSLSTGINGGSHVSASIQGNIGLTPNAAALSFNVRPYAIFYPFDSRPELDVPANIYINGYPNPSLVPTGIHKNGSGQMRLSGNNTFAGLAAVNGGTLIAASAAALGTTTGATAVNNDATLALDGGVTISGESLYLASTGPIALDSRTGANTWTGPINLTGDTHVNVDSSLTVQGVVSGSGNLIKLGAGSFSFTGTANNTYVGDTYINGGLFNLEMPTGVTAIPRHVIVGDASTGTGAILRQYSSFSIIGSVTVNANSVWNLNGNNEGFSTISPPPLTLNNGGSVDTSSIKSHVAGNLYLPVGGDVVVNPGTNTTSHISGAVGLDPGIHHFIVGKGSTTPGVVEMAVDAVISQTSTAAAIEKDGPGTLQLTGANTYTGTNVAAGGTFQVDGAQPASAVQVTSGTLAGVGTVGPIYPNGSSGVVSPGDSPGILNCANFNPGSGSGSLQIELNGTAVGSGYDQLNVAGTVNLTGVSLNATLGFASSTNDQFTIINNDGSDAVVGTFAGLPQDAKLYVGGQLFQITYTGGTGNDVVLGRQTTPPPPALVIQQVSSNLVSLVWPTNDPPFRLQIATNLPATNWAGALPLPVVVGTNNVVTNTMDNPGRFYRLHNP